MLHAITRKVGESFAECLVTFLERTAIDVKKAKEQHRAYEDCLRHLGARVVSLPAHEGFPDGVFVEDPAIVLDEVAVICRPGAESRRGETETLATALGAFRELRWIREPATIEGGDVVRIDRDLFVGLSRRTNREACAQLASLTAGFGYRVIPVEVRGCLHLKSACCSVGQETVLMNREWIDDSALRKFRVIEVAEEWAADVLAIGGEVVMPAGFPRTREKLERSGFKTREVDVSELQKAEAGVTCMSLVFES